ncbi:sulfotransferase [Sphingomonas sp. BGYR3]|uniref:tetratricopeptide repeat-containing sulfotransferase family protein n=1 Tax=Sphingomonas sp. BGYR3 TaxID=2975483 RepID=UPI0021A7F7D4|nr:sulfotransferase [Sphingomonas sp. BGYR3]MDG5487910.1 sulfotransferase [Sphingomonas sp. BGYR3]
MTEAKPGAFVVQALAALQHHDRGAAAQLLARELAVGPPGGDYWRSCAALAMQIGEIDTALQAMRRYARTPPVRIDRLLHYWGEMAGNGRAEAVLAEIDALPDAARRHPGVLHLLGTLASEAGDAAQAQARFREALAASPDDPQIWFALAMVKRFDAGDADLAAMERLGQRLTTAPAVLRARLLYAIAKAYEDCGDADRALTLYAEGAALRRTESRFNPDGLAAMADRLIAGFRPERMSALVPSGHRGSRAVFVNGLPRSGTTLVEQILVSHSAVMGGAEINLVRAALIPTGDQSLAGALTYQNRVGAAADPWGALARDYERMLAMRFGSAGLVVDKTLVQSHHLGLLLHMIPDARVIWLRRDPADTALSCFRSYFTASVPWSWSLTDIAAFFRIEDRLFAHWTAQFPDRILTLSYRDLVSDPDRWIPAVLAYVGLADEPQVRAFHETARPVRTASVHQVRAPISTARIGTAATHERFMRPFHDAYYR